MPTKVGIMSMQRIRNYGSSLQAYGLRRLIEGAGERVDVSFVDYRPGGVLTSEELPPTTRSLLHRASTGIGKVYGLRDRPRDRLAYLYHRRTYERRYFPLIGVPKQPNYDGNVDVLVIGSDEVFNFMQSSHEVGYSPELFGYGARADRLISYAASFGNTTLARVESSSVEHEIREGLRRFDTISVRDENSAEIVEHLIGRRPVIHLDPVLVYDFLQLEPRIPLTRRIERPYVVVYGYSGRFSDDENNAVRQYAESHELLIVCIGGIQDCCDEYVDCDPFELIAYFRDAEAVITDTFHGAILAIINQRPFAALVRGSVGGAYGNEEKLGYLLAELGLATNRVASGDQIEAALQQDVDYLRVGERLEQERGRTREYLAGAIADHGR